MSIAPSRASDIDEVLKLFGLQISFVMAVDEWNC